MCGIAGIFHYAEVDREVDSNLLLTMVRTLAHRGPDDERIYRKGPIGLGHRRLAIVDPSPTGAQPMSNPAGTCWLVYNGEFYNHNSYRQRLSSRGYTFRGGSDTETLLYLLEEEGPECLAEVAGIFAFAFWDERKSQLTLARDPLGVKQLYFHDDGRRILFASEIKALFADRDIPREADPEAVNQYIHFHTPLFERTFFKDVRQLRAGEYLRISPHGARTRTYWAVTNFGGASGGAGIRVHDLRDRLTTIVNEQLMADVPVGCFFSGGIDSSAVASFAARNGKPPECFGVHFSGQGVLDERPFQEAAAKSLGISLNLITSDGSNFADDLFRLMYYQDQPVIGPAMFPMYYVSKLAAAKVKVCLGGQGADEIFGGYARYALTRPAHVLRSWFAGRRPDTQGGRRSAAVGGNLSRQLWDRRNLYRLASNMAGLRNWEERYFRHMAKVPETAWPGLIGTPEFFDRDRCREMFHDTLHRSRAVDPADKVMHWDVQTYLTGLFQQDDRMAMAVSLESRVPLADPRLVRFAFETGFDLKFRGGATKWLLRQAVSDILPAVVLNRRKVGFDTPVELWINSNLDFVRDVLLSSRCRTRGIFAPAAMRALVDAPGRPYWIDLIWKALAMETWATVFLDGAPGLAPCAQPEVVALRSSYDPKALGSGGAKRAISVGDSVQEFREMGVRGAVARATWELKSRLGLPRFRTAMDQTAIAHDTSRGRASGGRPEGLLFANPARVAESAGSYLPEGTVQMIASMAREATKGRIISFGRWVAEYGNPIDWHRNPHSGQRWRADRHWSKCFAGGQRTGDVKLTWEVARFPHALLLGRAAVFQPEAAEELCESFTAEVRRFLDGNPPDYGIHWNSGQEIAIRLAAWLFGLNAFSGAHCASLELERLVMRHLAEGARHIAANIEFARDSVGNNHLISEAFGLYMAGMISSDDQAPDWMRTGRDLLSEAAEMQFFADGGYLQESHNYHRSVLQLYLCATALAKRAGAVPQKSWLIAIEKSLDFLIAHQNPSDGRLPNYGANDGSMPLVLTSCDFSDFRPTLQSASIACREERIYETGPWDEEAAWLFEPESLQLPRRRLKRASVSFPQSGFHVLRGNNEGNFGTFRCGSVLGRFSQIDMLHVDVWWRGHNVLVDPGSYLYNGPAPWHEHFLGTASHNTVVIDDHDQMVHVRKFKNVHLTRAALRDFEDAGEWAFCQGEHYGYRRYRGKCTHRRCVLFLKDDTWVVADHIAGSGLHTVRLHWLAGSFPYKANDELGELTIETPSGPFSISVLDQYGSPVQTGVAAGQEAPPRGWLSRYYGEKVPAPSLVSEVSAPVPITLVSILSGGSRPNVEVREGVWCIRTDSNESAFRMDCGSIELLNAGDRVYQQ